MIPHCNRIFRSTWACNANRLNLARQLAGLTMVLFVGACDQRKGDDPNKQNIASARVAASPVPLARTTGVAADSSVAVAADLLGAHIAFGMLVDVLETSGKLVLADALTNPALHVIDTARGELVRSFGRIGEGPGEYQSVGSIFRIDESDQHFFIWDSRQQKLSKLSIESEEPVESFRLTGQRVSWVRPLSNKRFLGTSAGAGGAGQYFSVFSESGSLLKTSGVAWLDADSIPRVERFRVLNGAAICVKRDRSGFAMTYRNAGRIEYYDSDVQLIKTLEVPEPASEFVRDARNGSVIIGTKSVHYLSCAFSDQHLFAIFSGAEGDGAASSSEGRELHVFDFSGRLVRTIRLTVPVTGMTVDAQGRRLFAVSFGSPAVYRITLPGSRE